MFRRTAIAVACAGSILGHTRAFGAPGDVSWRLVRPTNTGVPGDYTQAIFIDDDDSPWIGGYVTFWEEGGVGHFDGHAWRVLGNVDCPAIGSQIGAPRFNDIVKTADGVMWIGGSQGLMRFDPREEPWCVTRYVPSNSGIAGAYVGNIDIAPDGTLWMACSTWGSGTQGGLSHYDPATNTWESWDTSSGLPWWAGWDWVDYVAVQPDAGGGYTVWFGSREMGLTTYKDGLFIWYGSPTPPDVDPLPLGVGGKDAVDDDGNLLLLTDAGIAFRSPAGDYSIVGAGPAGLTTEVAIYEPVSGGRVLLGTYHADVFLWDGVWSHLGNWGSGNHTYTLAEDSQGNFWAGGIGGASKYENNQWQRYRLTNSGMISFFIESISHAPNGDVAMNGNAGPGVGGFDIMHPDGTWTNANVATYGMGLPWPYPTDDCDAVAYRANGNLLFAPTNNGLKELDAKTGLYHEIIANGWPIKHTTEDGAGRVWASTGRGSLFLYDEGMLTQFTNANSLLPVGDISGVVADPNNPGFIWIGAQFGLAHTDGTTWSVVPREALGLNLDTLGYHITCFDVAADGTLWIGCGIALFHYDPDTGTYESFTLANTPQLPSDDFFNVEIAPDGSVWVSTFDHVYPYPGGVSHFDGDSWTTYRASSSPLPHNQVQELASRPVADGYEVWVGTASEAVAVIHVEGAAACVADFNSDGELNFFDVQEFLSAFSAHDPSADITGEGVFDFFDVQEFLALFAAGCP